MRKITIIFGLIIFIFSCFMFFMVGFGGGFVSCVSSPDYCSKVDVYKWLSIIMAVTSLFGVIGMSKSLNNYNNLRFPIFVIVGIILPILIYIFLGKFVGSI